MLRFPDFEHDWESKKLKDLSNIQRGASPRPITAKKWYDNENKKVGWVRIGDVTSSSKYLTKTEDYFSEEGVKKSRFLPKGSLIMSICATIGKPIVTGMDTCIHDGFVGFSELKNINKEFLYYYLNILEPKFISLSQTGSQANLNSDLVRNAEIGVPSIQEQEKIVNFISAVDKKHNILNKNLETQLSFKKYLMQQIFTQKLRFDFKDTWDKVLLKDVAFIPKKTKLTNVEGLKLLTVKLHTKGIEINDRIKPKLTKRGRPYYIRRSGELLIGRQNFHNGGMGIVPKSLDGGICSNAISSFNVFEDKIDVNYLYYFLARPEYYIKSERLIGGTGQKEFSEKELLKLKIDLPSLEEQNKIVDFLLNIDHKIELSENQLNKTQEFKKGLLQQMFVC